MMGFSVNGVESLGSAITVLNGVGFTVESLVILVTTIRASSNQSGS
jgi:hypothetical protein